MTLLRGADRGCIHPIPHRGPRDGKLCVDAAAREAPHQGKAVQVDPIKPELKAPGTLLLKLGYDEPDESAWNSALETRT